MIKQILSVLAVFAVCGIPPAFAEELQFTVIEDTPVWSDSFPKSDNFAFVLQKNNVIKGARVSGLSFFDNEERFLAVTFLRNNHEYRVQADLLIPRNSESLFDDSWITGYLSQTTWATSYKHGSYWLFDGFLGVLLSENRDAFYDIEHQFIDDYNLHNPKDVIDFHAEEWYDTHKLGASLEISQALLVIGGFMGKELLVSNITAVDSGYRVTVHNTTFGDSFYDEMFRRNIIQFPYERQSFDLLLIRDNDYLDMYLDTTDNRLATFARSDDVIIGELNALLKTNTADLSKITFWPRRADGSTDYPPPDGTTVPDFQVSQKTHGELALPIRPRDRQSRSQTTDRLRVREKADTGSAIVTTLDTGTQVQVLETGTTETIGGITAPWVKVLAENGFTGWAFSGYLETLNPETQNQESTNQETENPDSENLNLENPKSSFSVLPFTVTGGAVLVAGIAVAVVLAKRRKGKAEKP